MLDNGLYTLHSMQPVTSTCGIIQNWIPLDQHDQDQQGNAVALLTITPKISVRYHHRICQCTVVHLLVATLNSGQPV